MHLSNIQSQIISVDWNNIFVCVSFVSFFSKIIDLFVIWFIWQMSLVTLTSLLAVWIEQEKWTWHLSLHTLSRKKCPKSMIVFRCICLKQDTWLSSRNPSITVSQFSRKVFCMFCINKGTLRQSWVLERFWCCCKFAVQILSLQCFLHIYSDIKCTY